MADRDEGSWWPVISLLAASAAIVLFAFVDMSPGPRIVVAALAIYSGFIGGRTTR